MLNESVGSLLKLVLVFWFKVCRVWLGKRVFKNWINLKMCVLCLFWMGVMKSKLFLLVKMGKFFYFVILFMVFWVKFLSWVENFLRSFVWLLIVFKVVFMLFLLVLIK